MLCIQSLELFVTDFLHFLISLR